MRKGSLTGCLIVLILVSAWFRVWGLENIPGINGDEAWYGVQASKIVKGHPFAMRTPTGLPLNPFFTGIEAPLLLVCEPSLWILRIGAVVSGLLAVFLIWVLVPLVLDRQTALIAGSMLAVLPPAIGYSRFGWDASQTPLLCVIALFAAFRGHFPLMMLSLGIGLIIHPSNIFLFPILLGPFLVALWNEEKNPLKRRYILGMTGALVVILAITLAAVTPRTGPDSLVARVMSAELFHFLRSYGRLCSGIHLFQYVAGPVGPVTVQMHELVFWGALLILLFFGVPRMARSGKWSQISLIVGLGVAVLCPYLLFGPDVLRPESDRYGMYLLVPTVIMISGLVSALLPTKQPLETTIARDLCGVVLLTAGVASLVSFKLNYFDAITATGGESHLTFRTAAIEPKQQATRIIMDDLSIADKVDRPLMSDRSMGHEGESGASIKTGHVVPVLAENWWLFWPMRFLTFRQQGLLVFSPEGETFVLSRRRDYRWDASLEELSAGGYAVAFTGGELDKIISSSFPSSRLVRWDVRDYSGRKVIAVFRVQP